VRTTRRKTSTMVRKHLVARHVDVVGARLSGMYAFLVCLRLSEDRARATLGVLIATVTTGSRFEQIYPHILQIPREGSFPHVCSNGFTSWRISCSRDACEVCDTTESKKLQSCVERSPPHWQVAYRRSS
jgi:hypothetical protein